MAVDKARITLVRSKAKSMKILRTLTLSALACFLFTGSVVAKPNVQEVQNFIDSFTERYVDLYRVASEADWAANNIIVENNGMLDDVSTVANEALSKHVGAVEVIEKVQQYLKDSKNLTPLQVRQLKTILYQAANSPQTEPHIVKERIAAENKQNSDLFGFTFKVDGEEVSTNKIDELLLTSRDENERLKVWKASKEVGKVLKDGLTNLVKLRNETVQGLGYTDFFSYQVADYGMTTAEMLTMNEQFIRDIWPLYRELHTWARYTLAAKYGATSVPDLIPAHWLPNRWAQDWSGLVQVEGLDFNDALQERGPAWLVQQAEAFYVSLGFEPLPEGFWSKSSLYPVAKDAGYKKNNHASAWHMDLNQDVRSLMSVEPNMDWYETTHHELGHIYYFLAYSTPSVPVLLREGANRAFHEAIGSLMGMASMQKPFLETVGLIVKGSKTDDTQALLKEALSQVVFLPFSAGTMTHFEHDLYAGGLEQADYNARWWEYVGKFQGVAAPEDRGQEYCDAATKTHINNDAAQYYDYSLSYIILQQLHAHIANKILHQNPHATNYFGHKEVGDFIKGILKSGSSKDWRQVMKDNLGQEISAKPMLDYYKPLMAWLKEQNKGRSYTLPEQPQF